MVLGTAARAPHPNGAGAPGGKHRSAETPEGPYEVSESIGGGPKVNREMIRLLDFVEQLEHAGDLILGLRRGREMRLIIHLVRNYLSGRLTTSSSLAAGSGLSYGTAMRTIERMKTRGLILERPRTESGKSVSLHPSAKLLEQWQGYATQCRILVGSAFRLYVNDLESELNAFLNQRRLAPTSAAQPVLTSKLALRRSLRTLVHADPTFMALNGLRRHFEMMFGVPIASRAFSIDRLRAEIIDNTELSASKYDLVACDFPWFGEMAAARRLLPLDDLMAESHFDVADFHGDALASTRYRGRQYGIPILMTVEMLVYRADLLAEAGVAPPITAREALDVARRLHNPDRGLYGLAWNGARGTPLGHSFIMIMGAFGRPVINLRTTPDGFDAERVEAEEMRPMFLSEEARETAEYLRELLDYSTPDALTMSWYDRAAAFADGRAAMAYSHSLLASLFELNERSPAYRRTGYVPHPIGSAGHPIAPLGGYALAIPANIAPERIPSVWTALQAFTSAHAVRLYTMNGSLACARKSVSGEPQVRAISPMLSAIDDMASRGILKMWPRPPTPDISDIITIAGEEIHDALIGRKSVRVALEDAQRSTDALLRRRGRY
jgi:multiple sugar transport system substrate-binding protein